jgi:hypothetical protein
VAAGRAAGAAAGLLADEGAAEGSMGTAAGETKVSAHSAATANFFNTNPRSVAAAETRTA